MGPLTDGQTLGYWLLVLATPFRGRAIPFHFLTYSAKTLGDQATSRNQEHFRAFAQVKALLGERPLVLDREFSYLELLQALRVEHIHFVIRLKIGLPQFHLTAADGQPLKLRAQAGKTVIYRLVRLQRGGPGQFDWGLTPWLANPAVGHDRFGADPGFRHLLAAHEN